MTWAIIVTRVTVFFKDLGHNLFCRVTTPGHHRAWVTTPGRIRGRLRDSCIIIDCGWYHWIKNTRFLLYNGICCKFWWCSYIYLWCMVTWVRVSVAYNICLNLTMVAWVTGVVKIKQKHVLGKYYIHHCYIVYWVKWCFIIHKILNLSRCIWKDLVRFGESLMKSCLNPSLW